LTLPPLWSVGTARRAVRARKAGATRAKGRACGNGSGGFTAGDAAARRPYQISFRHLWGKEKRAELLKTLHEPSKKIYDRLKPPLEIGLPFLPMKLESGHFKWPPAHGNFPRFVSRRENQPRRISGGRGKR
jgi:hypothetical protein